MSDGYAELFGEFGRTNWRAVSLLARIGYHQGSPEELAELKSQVYVALNIALPTAPATVALDVVSAANSDAVTDGIVVTPEEPMCANDLSLCSDLPRKQDI